MREHPSFFSARSESPASTRKNADRRASQAIALGLAAAASGYASKKVEDHYRYQAVREVMPTLDREVRRPEVQTVLAIHEHTDWPLVASIRGEDQAGAYTEWRHALHEPSNAYQVVVQQRSYHADFSEDGSGETSYAALRVRSTPHSGALLQELRRLNQGPQARDIIVEHVRQEVSGTSEPRMIAEGLHRIVNEVYAEHTREAHDGPAFRSADMSRTVQFRERPSNEQPNTVQFIDRPMTHLGQPVTVAELYRSDMVIYVNNIHIESLGRSLEGSQRTIRITADVIRDTGARLAGGR